MQSELSLILPTLNERENVGEQIRQIFAALPNIGEIVLVDDNSSDGTIEAAEAQFPKQIDEGRLRIHKRTQDFGLTPSLRDGIQLCTKTYVGWMDCDLSMPAALFNDMLQKISEGNEVCIGSRFAKGGHQKKLGDAARDSRLEIFLSSSLNYTLHFLMKLPISDYTSGFWVANRSLLNQIHFRGHHGEYFLDFISQAVKLGGKVTEVPYSCGTRKYGESKTFGNWKSTLRNSYRYFTATLKVVLET